MCPFGFTGRLDLLGTPAFEARKKASGNRISVMKELSIKAGAQRIEASAADGNTPSLRQSVYEGLRYRLITGKIAQGVGISTRGIAQQLGVSRRCARAYRRLAPPRGP